MHCGTIIDLVESTTDWCILEQFDWVVVSMADCEWYVWWVDGVSWSAYYFNLFLCFISIMYNNMDHVSEINDSILFYSILLKLIASAWNVELYSSSYKSIKTMESTPGIHGLLTGNCTQSWHCLFTLTDSHHRQVDCYYVGWKQTSRPGFQVHWSLWTAC